MKKIVSLFLVMALMLSLLGTTSVFAQTDELLENGDFEEGDATNFFAYGTACEIEVDSQYAHSGDYGLLLTNRPYQYSTYAYKIRDILVANGPGEYKASFWARLGPDSPYKGDCQLVINIQQEGDEKASYHTSKKVALTDEWQQFTFEGTLDFDLDRGFINSYFYPQSFDSATNAPDIMVDDFSLVKTSEVNGRPVLELPKVSLSHIDVTSTARDEETTFGAIRWDAWYTHDGVENSVISQVERSLSPSQFHFRAPFFAVVTDDNKIEVPSYTQEVFDKEMEYAIEAGVDYFAYVWYSSDMKAARQFHTTSKYKNDVKMCACFDGNAIGKEYAREEMQKLFLEDYYMTVLGGRPLMYYFGSSDNLQLISADIQYYRQVTAALGIPEPYAVIMNVSATEAFQAYGDAVSAYAIAGQKTYEQLAESAQNRWNSSYRASGLQYVPTVTLGWHPEPRYINPVTWTSVSANSWCDYATPEQIKEHVLYAYSYMQHPFVEMGTKANTLIAYAWNEHDEGGWLCPTIAVDENGKQLYNEDGTPKINDERIQAVKEAIAEAKAGNYTEIVLNGVSNIGNNSAGSSATATPSAEPTDSVSGGDQTDKKGISPWVFVGVGVAVVAIIACGAVIIIKKRKGTK